MVQTGINNFAEDNSESSYTNGPFGRRTVRDLGQGGQRIPLLASAQQCRRTKTAPPNPASTKPQFTNTNKARHFWHHPLQKCLLRAGTKSLTRTQGPKNDRRWKHRMGKTSFFFPTKHARQQHVGGRDLGTLTRTNPGLGDPIRVRSRLDRNTRPRRTTSECITRTLDQLDLVVQIRHTLWSRVSSHNKGAGEGEVLREGRSMTKLDPAVACIQKQSFTLNIKQPSSGQFF